MSLLLAFFIESSDKGSSSNGVVSLSKMNGDAIDTSCYSVNKDSSLLTITFLEGFDSLGILDFKITIDMDGAGTHYISKTYHIRKTTNS